MYATNDMPTSFIRTIPSAAESHRIMCRSTRWLTQKALTAGGESHPALKFLKICFHSNKKKDEEQY